MRRGLGRGQGGLRRRSILIENVLHVLGITLTIDDVVFGQCSFPQHDAAEGLGVKVDIFLNQRLHLAGSDIVTSIRCILGRGQTNVELRRGVGTPLNHIDPVTVVEISRAIGVIGSRAALAVVELNPDKVKSRVLDGIAELCIGDGTLRRTRDVEFPARGLFETGT